MRTAMAIALICSLLTACTPAPEATEASVTPGATCSLGTLPSEANNTVQLIEAGGPFPYPRNDGVTFGNYEGRLPAYGRGHYREYTVPTPGLRHRGTRRIVVGGQPPDFYYTGDHYESFCLIGDA